MSDRPDWLTPGTEVAVIRNATGGTTRVSRSKIDRVMKRDVVLESGWRCNADMLSRRTGDTWDGVTERLYPADAPEVIDATRRIALANARHRAKVTISQLDDMMRKHADVEAVQDKLDDVLAAVNEWRLAVTKHAGKDSS